MSKTFHHSDFGNVVVTKRRSSRNIRLRVTYDGTVHISMPIWLAYKYAVRFVDEKHDWIKTQRSLRNLTALRDGLRVGKTHKIALAHTSTKTPRTRVVGNELKIFIPMNLDSKSAEVIKIANKAIVRLLKKQATTLLAQRLKYLSNQTGYGYRSMRIGSMKTRWGSCTSKKEITLNCYLMQISWDLIDYVLLHELVHTEVMSHGKPFWAELSTHLPNYKQVRKKLKDHSPSMNLA